MKKILIVDDEESERAMLCALLRRDYHTDTARSADEALKKAAQKDFDVFLLDMIMPDKSGIDIIPEIKRLRPLSKVIILTGFPSVETAVTAVKQGASDYIPKPYRSKDLLVAIRRVLEEARFESNIKRLEFDRALATLSNPYRRRIIMLLKSSREMKLGEITRDLGMNDHTKALFHMKMLVESGLVSHEEDKSYSLTREGVKALECLNILEHYFEDKKRAL